MSYSNAQELILLGHQWSGIPYTAPTTVYCALFTVAPGEAGGGTEVSGAGYARVAVACNTTNFPNANPTVNATNIDFPTPGVGGWGTAVAGGFFSASTGGTLIDYNNLTVAKTINQGDTVSLPAGTFSFSLD